MGKKLLKSRKRREQTIAIIAVAAVVLILTAVLLIWGASNNENLGEHDHEHGSESHAELNLKVSLADGEDSIHYSSLEVFKKEVEEKSNGKISVFIYESEQLGTDAFVIDSMVKGKKVADIVVSSVSSFVVLDPRMDISALPFLFNSYEEAWQFMQGSIQKEIESQLIQKNVRVITHYSDGFEHLVSKKPISKVDELMGVKISAVDAKNISATIRCFNGQPLIGTEATVYQSLQNNQAGAYMGKLAPIANYNLTGTMRYATMTYHKYNALAFAISEDTWKAMTDEQQSIVNSAAQISANADIKTIKQDEQNTISKLEAAGIRVMYPELSSFVNKAAAVVRGASSQYSSYVERLINEYMKK